MVGIGPGMSVSRTCPSERYRVASVFDGMIGASPNMLDPKMTRLFLAFALLLSAGTAQAAEEHYSFSFLSSSLGLRPSYNGVGIRNAFDAPGISQVVTSFGSGGRKLATVLFPEGDYPVVVSYYDQLTIYQQGGYEDKIITITNNKYLYQDIWSDRPELNTSDTGVLVFANTVPIPEPETYALMMSGIAAVAFARRRHSGSPVERQP